MKLQNPFILEYDKNRFYCFQGAIMSNDFLRVTLQPTIPSLSISLLSVIFLQVFLNPQSSPLKKFKNKEKTWNLESTDHKLDNERSNGADSPRNGFPGKKKRGHHFHYLLLWNPFASEVSRLRSSSIWSSPVPPFPSGSSFSGDSVFVGSDGQGSGSVHWDRKEG